MKRKINERKSCIALPWFPSPAPGAPTCTIATDVENAWTDVSPDRKNRPPPGGCTTPRLKEPAHQGKEDGDPRAVASPAQPPDPE